MKTSMTKYAGVLETLGRGVTATDNFGLATLYSVVVMRVGDRTVMIDRVVVSGRLGTFLNVGTWTTLYCVEGKNGNTTVQMLVALDCNGKKYDDMMTLKEAAEAMMKVRNGWRLLAAVSVLLLFFFVGMFLLPWTLWNISKCNKIIDRFDETEIRHALSLEGFAVSGAAS